MAAPFQGVVPVIKVEDEWDNAVSRQVPSDQELMDMFRNGVRSRVELKEGVLSVSSRPQPLPPPRTPPVQLRQPPPPSPASPAPAPVHHPWPKRSAPGPPPGFAGVRQPPQKQYQRKQKAPAAQAQHAPQPAPIARRTPGPSGPPPVHASPGAAPPATTNAAKPALQRRLSAPRPQQQPAAKKKPSVLCELCGVLCMTAWHLQQHELGRRHRNKVACLAGEVNVWCQVCDVHLSGGLNVEQHNAGKQHLWRLHKGTP